MTEGNNGTNNSNFAIWSIFWYSLITSNILLLPIVSGDAKAAEEERNVITHRLMKIFAIITSIGAYLMVILGVLVTKTGSGQGCGNSWPFCHGQIIPGVLTMAGVIEYSHRIMSSIDGFLVLVLTVCTWLLYRKDYRSRLFAFLSLFFVVLQGALGAVTVVYEGTFVLQWLLSVHFGLSLIAFASVLLLTVRLFQISRKEEVRQNTGVIANLQYPILGLAAYTYIVVYTGALVSHAGAIMGCGTQLPGCGSTYLPNLTSIAGIQVLHRYAAGLLWFLVLGLLLLVMRRYRERREVVRATWWAFILISLQALSGAANILSQGQLLAALAHTTLISIFFTVLCYLIMVVGWPLKRARVVQKVELNPAS